jgi:hypothetical protein
LPIINPSAPLRLVDFVVPFVSSKYLFIRET